MRLYEFEAKKSETKTLYVSRKLKNADDLIAWAKKQGLESCLPASEWHVTIMFSKGKVDWSSASELKDTVRIKGGKRSLEKFGKDKDIVVLTFESDELEERWQFFKDVVGCSYDFPDYRPHCTITYSGKDVDIEDIEPYEGELVFGPEHFAEINDDYKDDLKEIKLTESLPGVKKRYNVFDTHDWLEYGDKFSTAKEFADQVAADPSDTAAHELLMKRWERMNSIPRHTSPPTGLGNLSGLKKFIAGAIGATGCRNTKTIPFGDALMGGPDCYTFDTPRGRVFLDATVIDTKHGDEVWLSQIATERHGNGLGSAVMAAIHEFSQQNNMRVKVFKVTNKKFFDKIKWLKPDGQGSYIKV